VIGRFAITTAEAWVPACRERPSICLAYWNSSAILGFSSMSSFSFGSAFGAFSTVMFRSGGINLAIRSTSAYGISSTRPTSRTATRGFHVPKVMSCVTFSLPYFSPT